MAKLSLNKPASGFNLAAINENFTRIEAEFQDKVLYRDNPVGEPNTLETDIDANSNNIYNVRSLAVLESFSVDGVDLSTSLSEVAASAAAAAVSETNAAISEANALNSEQDALQYSNDAAASYALADSIADSLAGGTIGMDAPAYDWGSVADATTYFNRDFGSIA
jgi:hypothetical protein